MSKKEEFNKLKVRPEYGGVVGEVPFAKYPRPQLKRDSFFNLNGKWDCGQVVPGALRQAQEPQPNMSLSYFTNFSLPEE